ncbi:hypothetical protein SBF1_1390004 [Candidatus Desulfosporosinus infrequens]|uniref:Uncharacterized protein n=1 Tax=Candidatus Desulfosporosinus infrequens TaxID=2043169 RepID=A0A2U3K4R7_9FIRM|nr:hypothetical protein SBF1_1390004 [Candidatus Desulfosporosinus infrequens]
MEYAVKRVAEKGVLYFCKKYMCSILAFYCMTLTRYFSSKIMM